MTRPGKPRPPSIADILTKDRDWFGWSSGQTERWADQGRLCYDAIIFAELAVKFDTQKELEHRLAAFTFHRGAEARRFNPERDYGVLS